MAEKTEKKKKHDKHVKNEDDAEHDDPEKDGLPLTLEELSGRDLQEMAKDKVQSRALQRTLLKGAADAIKFIVEKIQPVFMGLVRDQYGNYLCQKILEVCDAEQFDQLFTAMKKDLRELALDVHGTRAVQKVVEQAISREKTVELMQALPSDFIESLSKSVTGFHVVVKLIESLPLKDAESLMDLLCGSNESSLNLAKDQWGCCVIKKCLDRASDRADGDVKKKMVDAVVVNTPALVTDQYGNYVVQHVIQLNGYANKQVNVGRVIDALRGKMFELCLQKFSSNVLEKCLTSASDLDRVKVINDLLNPPNCLPSEGVRTLLFHQFGNYVFQHALEVAKEPQFSLLVQHSKPHIQEIVRASAAAAAAASTDAPAAVDGNLPPEHTRRLSVKLVKKYPSLAEGLEPGLPGTNTWAAYAAWGGYDPSWDPYGAQFGYDGLTDAWGVSGLTVPDMEGMYGYGLDWDPNLAGFDASGMLSTGQSKGKGRGRGKNAKKQNGASSDQTRTVGRIVGFWPNYEVSYDEVPFGAAGGGNGKKAKAKAKGKAKGKAQ